MKLSAGFNNVDCSNGTCDGCNGVFGFDFESALVATAESGGTVNLTLVRLAGTDGEITVTVDVIEGNATASSDYGGTWPTQVCVCARCSGAVGVSARYRCSCCPEDCVLWSVKNSAGVRYNW